MSQNVAVDEEHTATEDYSTQSDLPRTSSDPEGYSDDSRYVKFEKSTSHIDHNLRGSTRSLKSAPELTLENGRYYCNDNYYMPCDEDEQTRLSILYQTYLFLLDHQITIGVIPRKPKRILEIGTGTGDWAMAAAERFPSANVVALDLTSAYFPGAAPPNVTFEVDNAGHEWTYNEPFDFIHIRELAGAFSDWRKIYAEVAKHLKTGGVVEVADHSLIKLTNEPENSFTSIFNGAIQSAGEKAGTPLNLDHLKKTMFDAAGLSITKTRTFDLPVGQWSSDARKQIAGKMALVATLEGIEASGLRLLTKWQGWTEDGARDLMAKVKAEVSNPEAKPYVQVQFVVARKIISLD